jgi:hypothetical protein
MTDPDRPAQFKYVAPDGSIIATGSLDFLNKQLEAHKTAEGAIRAAALAADTRIRARADALAAREAAQTNREIRAFADSVAKLDARLGALEKAKADAEEASKQERLADEIAAADEALKVLQADEGDLETKPPPNEVHAEEIEARGGSTSAEEAIGTADQLPSGGSPSLPQRKPEPYRLVEPMGALPSKSDAADLAEFGRTFMTGRDRKAARKAMQLAARR